MVDNFVARQIGWLRTPAIFVALAFALSIGSTADQASAQSVVWEETYDLGLPFSAHVSRLFVHPNGDVFLGTDDGLGCGDYCGSEGFVYRSTDFGQTWNATGYVGAGVTDFAALPGGDLLTATLGGVFVSDDGGDSWSEIPTSDLLRFPHSVYAIADSVLYLGLGGVPGVWSGGLYGSPDGGQTWEDLLGLASPLAPPFWDFEGLDNGSVLAASYYGVWIGTNGTRWSISGLDSLDIRQLAGRPSGPVYASSFDSVYRTDHGEIWESTGLPATQIQGMTVDSRGHPFVGTASGLFGLIPDTGTWLLLGDGYGQIAATPDDHLVMASLHGELFRTSTRVVLSSDQAGVPIPDLLTLDQNFPNPFSTSTAISFTLTSPTHVDISVIDVSGRMVARLMDATTSAGRHALDWSAGDLPSGSYFVRIEAGGAVASRRVIVVR